MPRNLAVWVTALLQQGQLIPLQCPDSTASSGCRDEMQTHTGRHQSQAVVNAAKRACQEDGRTQKNSNGLPSLVRARLDGSIGPAIVRATSQRRARKRRDFHSPLDVDSNWGTADGDLQLLDASMGNPRRAGGSAGQTALSLSHSLRHRLSASSRTQTTNILACVLLRRTGERSAERPAHAPVGTRPHRPLVQRIPQGPERR